MVFHKDPCGIFCLLLTYGMVLYADYVVIQHVVSTSLSGSLWGPLHATLFNIFVFALLYAHSKAVFSDPGTVPLPRKGLDFSDIHMQKNEQHSLSGEDWTVCQRCETYRPPRAHHCKVCQRCIRRMDHHCPWVNNCIGELNQRYFIQFLFYTGVLCLYALSLNIANWVWLFGSGRSSNADLLSRKATVAHGIGLCIESIIFGLFVTVMLYDQLASIIGDETSVEHTINRSNRGRKTRTPRPRKSKMALFREVFGYGSVYGWFLPCTSVSGGYRGISSGSYEV